jgi:hypothetical protein
VLYEEECPSSSLLLTTMFQSPGVTNGWLLPGTPPKIMTIFFRFHLSTKLFSVEMPYKKSVMRVRQNTYPSDPILDLTDLVIKCRSVFCDEIWEMEISRLVVGP